MIGESEIELKGQIQFDQKTVFSLVKMWHEGGDLKGLEFRGWKTYKEYKDDKDKDQGGDTLIYIGNKNGAEMEHVLKYPVL